MESLFKWKAGNINDKDGVVTNYKQPTIDKTVNGQKKIVEIDREEEYKYNLKVTTPGDIDKYKALGVTATLNDRLEFVTDGTIADGWNVEGTSKDNIK